MKEIQLTVSLKIHSGKLEDFKTIAAECMNIVREKDTGTLQYDWFFNQDQTECHVREQYRDSEAILEHMGNLGENFGRLLAITDFSAKVYGSPSEALLKATEGLNLAIYSSFQKK